MSDRESVDPVVSRRDFVRAVGGIGVVGAVGGIGYESLDLSGLWEDTEHYVGTDYDEYTAADVMYTTCGQCNTFCPIKVQVREDASGRYPSLVRKLAGNPYSFLNTQPYAQIPYGSDPEQAATGTVPGTGSVDRQKWSLTGGRICLKGQAGIQTAFDTYRVRKPMKRVGDRGSGEWETITWDEAIDAIVEGDADLGTPGLRDLWAYVPQGPVMDDWERVQNDEMSQDAFDEKYGQVLIDTRHPDLGPKANQIVDVGGFRRNFVRARLFKQGLGTVNSVHHAGTCGLSSVMGNVHSYGGLKKRQYPDVENTEYLIVWGTNPMVANKGPTWLAPKLTNAIQDGMRMDVVDPRLSKTAEKAHRWVPINPGADAALALGMARWIIENNRYDLQYLENPSKAAAAADDEPTWSDATHLVLVDADGAPKARTGDLGLPGEGFVVVDAESGSVVPATEADAAVLDVDVTVEGTRLKSAWTLYRERVFEYTLDEYAGMAGIPVSTIEDLANEFTSHGKRAAIMQYRGPAKHTNGLYNTRAIATLQHLIGNYDWKGGQITPYAGFATMAGRYDLGTVPDANVPWGISVLRGGVNYEDTSLFDGYPAKRPWFEVAPPQINHELYGSAADAYPYAVNALFIRPYSENHVMAVAGGDKIPAVLASEEAIPLVVAFDTVIGETSQYADFLLPEPTYLERWENFGTYPNKRLADEKISHPVISVVPDARPAEDVLIDVWKRMDLPGVGEGAILDRNGDAWPLDRAEDFYLKLVANLGFATKAYPNYDADTDDNGFDLPPGTVPGDFPDDEVGPVPDASDAELAIFEQAHATGLGDAFDVERWKAAVAPDEWRKVVTVLNRGGRFEEPIANYAQAFERYGYDYDYAGRFNPSNAYIGEHLRYRLGSAVYFYAESIATGKHSFTGERHDPLPRVEDIVHYDGTLQAPVVSTDATPERPLRFVNWKPRTQGMHRTTNSPWLRETRPENPVWINPADATPRGIENGDAIEVDAGRVTVTAKAMVTDGIKPGVVGAMWGWGRTGDGASAVTTDGETAAPAGRDGHTPYRFDVPMQDEAGLAGPRDAGFAVNHIQPLDRVLGDVGLSDPVGGSNAQYDAFVEIRAAGTR